jgi:hypothetical protein
MNYTNAEIIITFLGVSILVFCTVVCLAFKYGEIGEDPTTPEDYQ